MTVQGPGSSNLTYQLPNDVGFKKNNKTFHESIERFIANLVDSMRAVPVHRIKSDQIPPNSQQLPFGLSGKFIMETYFRTLQLMRETSIQNGQPKEETREIVAPKLAGDDLSMLDQLKETAVKKGSIWNKVDQHFLQKSIYLHENGKDDKECLAMRSFCSALLTGDHAKLESKWGQLSTEGKQEVVKLLNNFHT